MYGRISLERVKRHMTKPFTKIEQLNKYMVQHLYTLYDDFDNVDGADYMFTFLEGSIETTQHYLTKAGVKYMEFETYIDTVDAMKWEKA